MSKLISISVLLLSLLTPIFAVSSVSVPQPVLDWYSDVVLVMSTLVKDLDTAKDAKTAARAFTAANTTIQNKQIAARRDQLEAQYADFFIGAAKDSTWVAPGEWLKLMQEFGNIMQKYSNTIAMNAKLLADPTVLKSMDEFGNSFQSIDSTAGK